MVEVDSLKPGPHRTRVTTAEQLERVTTSIAELGFNVPILVRDDEIIDGHVRVEAAQRLGLALVPAVDCSHLSDVEVRKLRLAANRIGELGEWDLDKLKIEFQELIDLDVDLTVTGFSAEEQDIILLDPVDPNSKAEQELEPPEHPVSQPGDLWLLNDHRVICGDSREQSTFQALLGGELAHAVLSDPPYNVKIQGNVSGLGKKVHDEFAMASGELDEAEWQQFLDTTVALVAGCVVPGSVLFLFMDWRSIHRLYAAGFNAGLKLLNLAVWYKESGGMGALYRSSHELVAVFCQGDKPHTNNVELGRHGRDRQNVWCAPGANRRGSSANSMLAAHATPKPVELCVDALLDVTARGQIVLDAFLGSGTTLVAAEQTGRRCFGVEYEPRFVDVCLARWTQLTGAQAVLHETGETFEDVKARRLASDERAAELSSD
jgi:DNA modification methylase